MKTRKLSIVVLSYNTKDLLRDCLSSLSRVKGEVDFEIIVPDNGSSDGSPEMVKKEFSEAKLLESEINLGFAAGNNLARELAKGEYILFLNSDTVVHKNTLKITVEYLDFKKDVGALTCKMILGNGDFDKDTRRAFITPWIGLVHLFLKLDRVFPKSPVFAKYWYGYIPDTQEHEVDVIEGAFFLTRKKILDSLDWFDEDYFLDGEDIDLCWKIKSKGWKIIYCPKASITHYKGAAKGKVESIRRKKIPLKDRLKFRMAGVNSMELFYKKHMWKRYPLYLNLLVILGINTMKLIRLVRTLILG